MLWEHEVESSSLSTRTILIGSIMEFLEKLNIKVTDSGCWEWRGAIRKDGYPTVHIGGRCRYAHRASYAAYKGEIPRGMFVCHKCDNPPCVNPDHLFLGTHQDNMNDAVSKFRIKQGETHHKSKLTDTEIVEIFLSKEVTKSLADKHGVSKRTIQLIRTRRFHKRALAKLL